MTRNYKHPGLNIPTEYIAMKNFLKFKTGEKSSEFRKFGEEYYLREAKLWRPFRIGGIVSIGLSLPFAIGSIFNDYWTYGEGNYQSIFNTNKIQM